MLFEPVLPVVMLAVCCHRLVLAALCMLSDGGTEATRGHLVVAVDCLLRGFWEISGFGSSGPACLLGTCVGLEMCSWVLVRVLEGLLHRAHCLPRMQLLPASCCWAAAQGIPAVFDVVGSVVFLSIWRLWIMGEYK